MIKYLYNQCQTRKDDVHQFIRYGLIGGWNTVFGLGVYTLLFELLGKHVNYLALTIPANILAITNAFLCYKLIVFKTKGNWWREYWRCYTVYGSGALLGMGLLFILVTGCGIYPVAAQFITVPLIMIISYLGHKFFSFRSNNQDDTEKNTSE